jgi:hypothetical protein
MPRGQCVCLSANPDYDRKSEGGNAWTREIRKGVDERVRVEREIAPTSVESARTHQKRTLICARLEHNDLRIRAQWPLQGTQAMNHLNV